MAFFRYALQIPIHNSGCQLRYGLCVGGAGHLFLCHTQRAYLHSRDSRAINPRRSSTLTPPHRRRPPVKQLERDSHTHPEEASSIQANYINRVQQPDAGHVNSKSVLYSDAPQSRIAPSRRATRSVYEATLRKRVIPRHIGARGSLVSDESVTPDGGKKDYDPSVVVRLDSRRRQVQLNPVQKELLWTARQKVYHHLLGRVVTCLQSHLLPVEKCHTLLSLHEEAIEKRLRLRSDTYEDIFHVFYAVAVSGHIRSNVNIHANTPQGNALLEEDLQSATSSALGIPAEFATPAAVSSSLLSSHMLQNLWGMYRYMVDSGTNPTSRVVQYLMGVLEHACLDSACGNTMRLTLVEAKAHSLMMDLDRFGLAPTEYTINAYIGVCSTRGVMHMAVARVADYQARHERQASPGMYARLITGLLQNRQYDQAITVATSMNSVPMSRHLLNAVLQAARHSSDPFSAFSMYRAVMHPPGRYHQRAHTSLNLSPSLHTVSILLEVMIEQRDFRELDFVLGEMRAFHIKGNGMVLNKLLGALYASRRTHEAATIQALMVERDIPVFDEYQRASKKSR